MDILLVTGSFPERSETFIYRKAITLANRGHDVTVATRRVGDWSLYSDPLPETLSVEVLPPDTSLRGFGRGFAAVARGIGLAAASPSRARELWTLCSRNPKTKSDPRRQFLRHLPFLSRRFDVAHIEFLSLAPMYPLLRELLRAPLIVSCRGSDVHTLESLPRELREATLTCLKDADTVHCVSEHMARAVTALTGRTKAVVVNRPAVDVSTIVVRPNDSTETLRIIATGRLVWQKGFEYLLSSFRLLRDAGVPFQAEIIGDGELKSALRYSIDDLGLGQHVTLVGSLSAAEVLARMQWGNVFVLSSVSEGISNAVLEAMASGLPIVTTSVGGMPEAVDQGVEGILVAPRDPASLADGLARLASSPTLRMKMGVAARTRAEREFSLARQVETFETIYRSVITS